jgi:hypothetical protein
MPDGGPRWGGKIDIPADPSAPAHLTIYSNSGQQGDSGARLSADIQSNGQFSNVHATNQNVSPGAPNAHDISYVRAPSIDSMRSNPDQLGSAPCTHPREV